VAPTQQVPVIRAVDGQHQGSRIRWGLIPFFAKGEPPKYSTINARIETVETAASYRGPWKRGQRCLQVAAGFFEWHLDDQGRKAPFYITVVDQPVFAFAGLWDHSVKADGTAIESCVHITMPANDLMKHIHNTGANPHRMPAILRREDRDIWLNGSVDEARSGARAVRSRPDAGARGHDASQHAEEQCANKSNRCHGIQSVMQYHAHQSQGVRDANHRDIGHALPHRLCHRPASYRCPPCLTARWHTGLRSRLQWPPPRYRGLHERGGQGVRRQVRDH
jgi:putative SOS response-associated peptidase YedK